MVAPIPAGREGVVPHLVVSNAKEAIEFYGKAFGAKEIRRSEAPDGRLMHAEIQIGSSFVYVCDDFPEFCGGASRTPGALGATPVTIHRFVADCDAAAQAAVEAGATMSMPPMDMFWGDRYAKLTDPYGHEWSLATHVKDVSPEECDAAAAAFFS